LKSPDRLRRFVALATAPCIAAFLHAAPATGGTEAAFLASVEAGFPAWDADSDGKLTPLELDLALADPAVRGDSAAAAAALRRASRARPEQLKNYTLPEFPGLVASLRFKDSREEEEPREYTSASADSSATLLRYFREARRRIAEAPADLFVGAPDAATLKQGRLGSCFSLAPLLAVGLADPSALADRFDPRPDGSVRVRFGVDRVVVVPPLTDGELALATTTAGNGRWAAVYEKGAGILRLHDKPPSGPATPHSAVTRGGSAGAMLATFTGRDIRRFSCRDWLPGKNTAPAELDRLLQRLRDELETTFAAGRLATAGTSGKTTRVPGLSQNHAYAVLAYNRAADLVAFRDPHAQNFTPEGDPGLEHGYVVQRGVFHVPLPEAVRLMAGFAFQTGSGDGTAPPPVAADTDA
jgi:hypothetical protein